MSNPVKIVAILAARPGKADELKALLSSMLARSRAEPGNLRWDIWQDQADPDRFVLDELYTDKAAAAAHRETRTSRTTSARSTTLPNGRRWCSTQSRSPDGERAVQESGPASPRRCVGGQARRLFSMNVKIFTSVG